MEDTPKLSLRNNPVFIIAISCLIALLMTAISFWLYYRSDTRQIVEQVQANSRQLEQQVVDDAQVGVLDSDNVDSVEQSIINTIEDLNDETDFSAAELTDSALGL
jgi:capsular polysaccharide biosynthesis protein